MLPGPAARESSGSSARWPQRSAPPPAQAVPESLESESSVDAQSPLPTPRSARLHLHRVTRQKGNPDVIRTIAAPDERAGRICGLWKELGRRSSGIATLSAGQIPGKVCKLVVN